MSTHTRALIVGLSGLMLVAAADHNTNATPASVERIPVDTFATMYDVGGVTVIQRRTTTGEIAAAQIYMLGGSQNVDSSNAGIEALVLAASEYGTKSYPGTATRAAIARTGSTVGVSVGPDWTTLQFVGLAEDFDSTWAVVADRIVHPTLDSAAIAIGRGRALAAAAARVETPEGIVRQMAESLAFVGHPYRNPTGGTLASLNAITLKAAQDFHWAHMVTSRLLVVVAGNVTRAQVEGAVTRTLATLPKGSYKWTLPPKWAPKAAALVVQQRQLPTNYVFGLFGGPQLSDLDAIALQGGLGFIGGQMFGPMRDSGLTYAAGGGFMEQGASGGYIEFTTPAPDRSMKIVNEAIDLLANRARMEQGGLTTDADGLARNYLIQMQTTESQVETLGNAYLYHGDFRYTENFQKALRQVGFEAVTRSLRAYAKNIQWAYLGDTMKVPRAMFLKY